MLAEGRLWPSDDNDYNEVDDDDEEDVDNASFGAKTYLKKTNPSFTRLLLIGHFCSCR